MKLKTILIASAVSLASTSLFAQTVSLEIASGNFADTAGNPVAGGTLFGIVVDTDGSGFAFDNYGPSSLTEGTFLSDGAGAATTNALVKLGTSEAGGPPPTFDPGWISFVPSVPHSDGTGVASTGDQWGIMWFPGLQEGAATAEGGQSYGFYTDENLTIPSAGSTVTYSEFIGNDIKTADYTIVPEPSTYAAIFGFGVLLFVFLRRRFKK